MGSMNFYFRNTLRGLWNFNDFGNPALNVISCVWMSNIVFRWLT